MMAGDHSEQTSLDKQHAKSAGGLLKTAGLARSSSEFNLSAGAMGVRCRGAVRCLGCTVSFGFTCVGRLATAHCGKNLVMDLV